MSVPQILGLGLISFKGMPLYRLFPAQKSEKNTATNRFNTVQRISCYFILAATRIYANNYYSEKNS